MTPSPISVNLTRWPSTRVMVRYALTGPTMPGCSLMRCTRALFLMMPHVLPHGCSVSFAACPRRTLTEFGFFAIASLVTVPSLVLTLFLPPVPLLLAFSALDHVILTRLPSFFEHAATMVGIDYMSHPFWDKYIEFEERSESPARVYAVLARIVRIPLHQFNRYFERFRPMIHELDLEHLAPADVLERARAEVQAEAAAYGAPRAELEVQRDIRAKIDNMYLEVHTATQTEVTRVWAYESELGHQFFHTVELSHQQLNGWRKYLDFEEAEGDFARTKCVYERCITVCAFYDDFWFRYARWMSGQGKVEEVRHIYLRAAFFVPISRPGIRMQWAYFEESQGRVDVARDIHEAILMKLPDCIEVIVSWAHLQRRQKGVAAAVQVLRDQIDAPIGDLYTKAALVAEWAMLLWKTSNGAAEPARAVFLKNAQWYGDSRNFWEKWFQFELEQHSEGLEEIGHRVRHVFTEFRRTSRLPAAVKRDMAQIYLDFLVHGGGQNSMLEYLDVDREMFG